MNEIQAAIWTDRLNRLGITRRQPANLTQTVVDAAQRRPLGERYVLADGEVPGLMLRLVTDGSAFYSFRFRNDAGKQPRLTLGAAKVLTLEQARQRARAELLKVGQGGDPAKERTEKRATAAAAELLTVRAYLEHTYGPKVLAHHKSGGAPTAKKAPTGVWGRILAAWAPLLKEPLPTLTRDQIEKVLTARKDAGLAAGTLLRDWGAFRAMLADAVDRKVMVAIPMARRPEPIRKLRGNQRVRWLGQHDTAEQLASKTDERSRFTEALAAFAGSENCTGDFLRFAARLALSTGMRRGEIVRLSAKMINLREKSITLPKEITKSNKSRVVYLNSEALAALAGWTLRGTAGELCPGDPAGWEIQISARGWPALRSDAGIEDLHFHDLRHDFAVRMLRGGATLAQVRDALGHASIVQTEKYAHLAPSDVRAAVIGMGKG
jgi:integrase